MFTMQKITLITTLALLMTCQAQAAKFITEAASAPAVAATQPPVKPATISAAPTPTPTSPATRPAAAGATSGTDTSYYLGAQLGDSSVGAVMGYQITKMFSMEVSYDYFDPIITQANTQTIADKNRWTASGLAKFPLKFSDMGPMSVFVNVGYARTTDKFTINDPGLGAVAPSTVAILTRKKGVTGGFGIHVDISPKSSVRVGFNVVGADRTTSLVALYRF